jgi:hypothetical protein
MIIKRLSVSIIIIMSLGAGVYFSAPARAADLSIRLTRIPGAYFVWEAVAPAYGGTITYQSCYKTDVEGTCTGFGAATASAKVHLGFATENGNYYLCVKAIETVSESEIYESTYACSDVCENTSGNRSFYAIYANGSYTQYEFGDSCAP